MVYRITKTAYGFKIVLQGVLELKELRCWLSGLVLCGALRQCLPEFY